MPKDTTPRRIGKYRTRLVRMVYAGNREAKFGAREADFTDGPTYFAEIEELNASVQALYSQRDSRATAEIKLRGRVALSARDRLRVKASGVVYELDGVRVEGNETVASAFRHTG
jgi:hypothetical protein